MNEEKRDSEFIPETIVEMSRLKEKLFLRYSLALFMKGDFIPYKVLNAKIGIVTCLAELN